jgi:predicted acyl esterase
MLRAMRGRTLLALGWVVALVLALAPGVQAQPAPFGHACTAQDGVRFCPTTDLASRVPSWDGVPLDVDVTLPPTGDGPFPTILLLHGLGGNKKTFQGASGAPAVTGGHVLYNAVAFAKRGYAVVTPTARGFGNSCGTAVSRTAGCEKGWARLDDIRWEVRDIQWLTGLLVDEGITDRKAIGATGVSYGGGASTMLAFLRNRVMLPDGSLKRWKSPEGRKLRLTAAWPRWLWTNGESIFTRNGRGGWTRTPQGVPIEAWADLIFGVANGGFVAPFGSELTADIRGWKALLEAGTLTSQSRAVLDNAFLGHGVASLTGRAAALLMQTGWTDALFPVPQALAGYHALRERDSDAPVAMQIGDLGHFPAANHPSDSKRFAKQGLRFFDAWLLGKGKKPSPGRVTALRMTCPATAPSGGGPYRASSFEELARGALRFGTGKVLRITSEGASATLAAQLSPTSTSLCTPRTPDPASTATFATTSPGVTLIGLPVLTGRVKTKGRYGQMVARVWDLDPATDTQRLITRGVYRLEDDQRGRFRFVLDGNGWRFPAGHRIVVELLGRDAPAYQASPAPFSAKLRKLRIRLPVRERG